MSQPFDRSASIPAPGKLDKSLKEFWVTNPWHIVAHGHNLSSFERQRMYFNQKGKDFLEVSHLSGTDNDGDGRAVVAGDFTGRGQLDLLVRQAGGWPLLLYENRLPRRHSLTVTLRGDKSNRWGIGSRLTATAGGLTQTREMYPINTFKSQAPNRVHFGLGDSATVDVLTVRWPSGKVTRIKALAADRHVIIDEGDESVRTVVPGEPMDPAKPDAGG